jgi:hypothetical protein
MIGAMRAIRISGADPLPLGAPADWKEEDGHCGALFIRREVISGVHYMRSAWEVEVGEAALLYAGARLTLGIAGQCHPVVHLQVADLPADFEPVVHARRFNHTDGRPCVRVEMLFPHAGGRRGFCEEPVDGTLADAVSSGISRIEALARREGWIE